MDEKNFVFRPNKIYTYMFPFLILGVIAFQYVFYMQMVKTVSDVIGYIIITPISFVAVLMSFEKKRVLIEFNEDGVKVISCKNEISSISYSLLQYAYFCSDRQGYKRLLLSSDSFEKRRIQKIVNKKIFYGDYYQDGYLMFSIHNATQKELDNIISIVEKNISNIIKM